MYIQKLTMDKEIEEKEKIAKEIIRLKQEINTLEVTLRNYKPGSDAYNGLKNRINSMIAQVKSLELRLKVPTDPDKPTKPPVPHADPDSIEQLRNTIFLLEVSLKQYKPGTPEYNALLQQIGIYRTMLKTMEDPDSVNPVVDPIATIDTMTPIALYLLAAGGLYLAYRYI